MDYDERFTMNEEAHISVECQCEACDSWITGPEALDPIEIEGRIFCTKCANDLVSLRLEGYLKSVSERTGPVVEREAYNRASFRVHPQRTVKHI